MHNTGRLQILWPKDIKGTSEDMRQVMTFMCAYAQRIEIPAVCNWCGERRDKLLTCNGCKNTKYCDKDCQMAHYRNGHKNCKIVIQAMEAAAAAGRPATEESAEEQPEAEAGAALANMSLDEGVAKRRGD